MTEIIIHKLKTVQKKVDRFCQECSRTRSIYVWCDLLQKDCKLVHKAFPEYRAMKNAKIANIG